MTRNSGTFASAAAERALGSLAELASRAEKRDSTEALLSDALAILEEHLRGDLAVLSYEGRQTLVQSLKTKGERERIAPTQLCPLTVVGSPAKEEKEGACRAKGGHCDNPECPAPTRGQPTSRLCVPINVGDESLGTFTLATVEHRPETLKIYEHMLRVVAGLVASDVKTRRLARLQIDAFEEENLRLREALADRFRPENFVGNSPAMREVYKRISQVAQSDTAVLVRGESGTGKELVASAVHYGSSRAKRPFVRVNCAALTESLLESELFGHERGAFTGAVKARRGRIEEAEGGSLFLDEIGDFSPAAQVKLLRVLQEKEFERVGSDRTQKADVRIITATNRDLEAAVRDSKFREDLYYRINVFPVNLPPLRERRGDILQLTDHFVSMYANKMGKEVQRISTPAISMLLQWNWPGNVRELENCIEHAVLLSSEGVIHSHHLPPTLQAPGAESRPAEGEFQARVEALERDMIVDALKRNDGNSAAAARELGLTSRKFRYKTRGLGIDVQSLLPDSDQE